MASSVHKDYITRLSVEGDLVLQKTWTQTTSIESAYESTTGWYQMQYICSLTSINDSVGEDCQVIFKIFERKNEKQKKLCSILVLIAFFAMLMFPIGNVVRCVACVHILPILAIFKFHNKSYRVVLWMYYFLFYIGNASIITATIYLFISTKNQIGPNISPDQVRLAAGPSFIAMFVSIILNQINNWLCKKNLHLRTYNIDTVDPEYIQIIIEHQRHCSNQNHMHIRQ